MVLVKAHGEHEHYGASFACARHGHVHPVCMSSSKLCHIFGKTAETQIDDDIAKVTWFLKTLPVSGK